MGVTAHELRHLLRAFEGLSDVDVILDNTLAGPIIAKAATSVPVVTVAHGPLIPLEQELYLAAASEVAFVAISHNQASLSRARCRSRGSSTTASGSATCRWARAAMPRASSAGCIRRRASPRRSRRRPSPGIPLRIAAKMQEPAEEEYFEEVVRPALGTNAEYVGELDTDEKYELMGNSCALLNPIQWDEPFGLVMIEAMATGTPVVATRRGSVEEIVEEGRTGFIRSTPEDLGHALLRASTLDRAACRESVETRFSDSRMAADYIELFEDLLHGAAAADPCGRSAAGGDQRVTAAASRATWNGSRASWKRRMPRRSATPGARAAASAG